MSDEKQAATKETPTYSRDRLIAEAGVRFGQPSYVVVGALSMAKPANKQDFTIDEVKSLVKEYLDHEVEMVHTMSDPDEEKKEA